MFEPAKNLVISATSKYNLTRQAVGAMVCERVRKFLAEHYADYAPYWEPQKFRGGVLTIKVTSSSAASVLFMKTHEIMEKLKRLELPEPIKEIQINKG